MRHSMYILDRLPTRSLTGRTLYEAWKGDKPNIGHVRVFGFMAYMKIPGVHTKKLDDRSKPVIHLGNEPRTKAMNQEQRHIACLILKAIRYL